MITLATVTLLEFLSSWWGIGSLFIVCATVAGIIQTLSGKPAPKAPWDRKGSEDE
jgi:hypothetical protein